VKAAIIGARQENAAFAKDGKTLLGPVLPRLQARHGHGGARQDGRDKGAGGGRGDDKPPAARHFVPNGRRAFTHNQRERRTAMVAHGKENKRKNAPSPPAQAPGAKTKAEA
jgi:hypothetical protein